MATLVIAEHDNQTLNPATLNTIAAGTKLDDAVDVLVAGDNCSGVADAAAKVAGVGKVLSAENPALAHALAENLAPVIVDVAGNYSHILFAATTTGKNVAPRVAALLDVAQISDILSVESSDTFKRPIYAGNIIATVQSSDPIKVITVRTTAFDPVAAEGGSGTVESIGSGTDSGLSSFVGEDLTKSDRPELAAADIVVSGGRGVGQL